MRRQRISILMTSAVGLVGVCMFLIGDLGMFPNVRSQTLSNWPQEKAPAGELAAAVEAQKQADAKLTRGESAERRFQEMGARLQLTAGTTPVIVRLAVAFRPEGEIQQEAERLAQRADIRQKQDQLLSSVFGGIPVSLKRFVYVPFIAVPVNSAELDALHASTLVLDVYADTPISVAQTQAPSLPLIGAPNAWASGYTGANKIIAILDTGVDKNHTALAGKVISEACYSTNMDEPEISSLCPGGVMESLEENSGLNCTVSPDCDHGTSVAGVATGVATGAKLISIKVSSLVNDEGQCGDATPCVQAIPSDLMRGLERVYDLKKNYNMDIAAANISAAKGMFTDNCDSNPIKATIEQLRSFGIATVVASGNDDFAGALGSPACVSTAVSVGATGDGVNLPADKIAPLSNSSSKLSLLAPGYYTDAPIPGGDYSSVVSGTSIAAAHVSGAWAILKEKQPSATVSEVLNRLKNSGVNVTDLRNNEVKPRIKIDGALSCLQNVPEDRWKGEYFDNPDLEGDSVMTRDDGGGPLNMNFGSGSPGSVCGPGEDNFSVRWTRKIHFTSNVYRFTVTADDGVRLYVGDEKVLDLWNGPAGTNTVNVLMNEGDPKITLEFREFVGTAQASLSWDTPCVVEVPAGKWKGEYFNDNPGNPNEHLTGRPLMVRDDGNNDFLNFNWEGGGPESACLLGGDYFSARWTRQVFFGGGPWKFTIGADNGVRLYVDGFPLFTRWTNTVGTDIETKELLAGFHEIKLEYFEVTGAAWVSLSWAPAPPNPPSNLAAIAVSAAQINLSWADNSNFENGYKIERWNGSWAQINVVGANVTAYADTTGLAPSTAYYYRVRAYNSVGDSSYSNEISATTFDCNYSISPTFQIVHGSGGSSHVTVSVGAGCSWSAVSNNSWITITSGASGAGNGIVNYSVQGFASRGETRVGTITIAGLTFTIEQHGPPDTCRINCVSQQSRPTALDQLEPGSGTGGLTARYFGNTTLSGHPALQRTGAIINFNWAAGSPDAALPADRFSVRWRGQLSAPSSGPTCSPSTTMTVPGSG